MDRAQELTSGKEIEIVSRMYNFKITETNEAVHKTCSMAEFGEKSTEVQRNLIDKPISENEEKLIVGENGVVPKIVRDDESQPKEVELTNRKKIVDIDNSCLERVFKFLKFSDLVNVAETNTHFKVAAEKVFARKLKGKLIIAESPEMLSGRSDIRIQCNAVCIGEWALAAKMIRLFGESIAGIEIRIEKNSLSDKFFNHINKYCHKTLNNFHVPEINSTIFGNAKHPFENLENFSAIDVNVEPECRHFERLFPGLRQLTYKQSEILDSRYFFETFPNLDSLTLDFLL